MNNIPLKADEMLFVEGTTIKKCSVDDFLTLKDIKYENDETVIIGCFDYETAQKAVEEAQPITDILKRTSEDWKPLNYEYVYYLKNHGVCRIKRHEIPLNFPYTVHNTVEGASTRYGEFDDKGNRLKNVGHIGEAFRHVMLANLLEKEKIKHQEPVTCDWAKRYTKFAWQGETPPEDAPAHTVDNIPKQVDFEADFLNRYGAEHLEEKSDEEEQREYYGTPPFIPDFLENLTDKLSKDEPHIVSHEDTTGAWNEEDKTKDEIDFGGVRFAVDWAVTDECTEIPSLAKEFLLEPIKVFMDAEGCTKAMTTSLITSSLMKHSLEKFEKESTGIFAYVVRVCNTNGHNIYTHKYYHATASDYWDVLRRFLKAMYIDNVEMTIRIQDATDNDLKVMKENDNYFEIYEIHG